jgi:hypothetical protein
MPRSRAPIGPHGPGQAGSRMCPLARRPVAMRPDGHQQAGTRKYPFASCGHPWAVMVTRKRREGCIARGKGLRPSDRMDPSERGEGATPRGSREAMRPHRRADEPEGSSDRRRGPLPSVSSIPSSTGEPNSIAPRGDSLRALGVVVGRAGPSLVGRRGWASAATGRRMRCGVADDEFIWLYQEANDRRVAAIGQHGT